MQRWSSETKSPNECKHRVKRFSSERNTGRRKTKHARQVLHGACGPGSALMVHVGECRERNHTSKDGDEREAEGERERNDEGKRDKPRPAHPDFLETENWIVAGVASPADLWQLTAASLIHVTDVSL
ncbi:hypothetical protein K0M31_012006 [Melipona bicolor]|uniref:Uncharacterized protein n=1 Tax=Melipona bicolor TaxID=60889 RepID=A0AA40KVJ7_9HYME|nr:hypothetical protein K0M31_012006 [Melipona bicolor]